jgi:glycosyltransferase involved in cell wall biosynthesis
MDRFWKHRTYFLRLLRRIIRKGRRGLYRIAGGVVKDPAQAEFAKVLRKAAEVNASLIWLGYGNISYDLLKYIKSRSSYKVVVDTDSVWSRFVLRGIDFAGTHEERERISRRGTAKQEEERWGTRLADATTAVSEIDAEYYRTLTDDPAKVHLFSNAVDLDNYRDVPASPEGFRKPAIFAAGSFWQGSPMEDAVRWLLSEVRPLVMSQRSDVHWYVVGRQSDTVLADVHEPDVTITGEVPSVLPYLRHASVAVVPLRFESGTRFKILEAGACGVPVVSTTLGAEGIPTVNGEHLLIADDPVAFADAIIRVMNDLPLASRLASNLRKLVSESNGLPALAREGEKILHALLKST